MADRDKVIEGLEYCECDHYCRGPMCPYYNKRHCIEELTHDALELLKEPEAVVPVLVHEGANKQRNDYKCPECHTLLYYGQRYCEWCGKKVKWGD